MSVVKPNLMVLGACCMLARLPKSITCIVRLPITLVPIEAVDGLRIKAQACPPGRPEADEHKKRGEEGGCTTACGQVALTCCYHSCLLLGSCWLSPDHLHVDVHSFVLQCRLKGVPVRLHNAFKALRPRWGAATPWTGAGTMAQPTSGTLTNIPKVMSAAMVQPT